MEYLVKITCEDTSYLFCADRGLSTLTKEVENYFGREVLHFQRISDESIIASEDAFDILLIQSNANHTELWLEAVLESD